MKTLITIYDRSLADNTFALGVWRKSSDVDDPTAVNVDAGGRDHSGSFSGANPVVSGSYWGWSLR